jgi:preprotein translocase subunit YajC
VLTAGGFYATVRGIDDDEITVELGPGTEARLDKRAIAAVLPPEDEAAHGPEAEQNGAEPQAARASSEQTPS